MNDIYANIYTDELHLSPVTGSVQMRPQFHHIDARSQMAKARHARERAMHEAPRATEPRLVQQSARTALDDEELNIAKTSAFLTTASEEHWMKLQVCDEDVGALVNFSIEMDG
jgi:DNA-directed RNA polymerase-3 subunit RPC5